MADPVTLAIGAVALGTAVKAGGQIQQGQANKAAIEAQGADVVQQGNITDQSALDLDAQAAASTYNAIQQEQQATYARDAANEEAGRYRVSARKELGELRVRYGATGLTLDGSAMDVLAESAGNMELNARTIQHEGEVKALALTNSSALDRLAAKNAEASASRIRSNAEYTKSRGRQIAATGQAAEDAGYLSATGTLLDGASSAYSMSSGGTGAKFNKAEAQSVFTRAKVGIKK